ncbi:MAG: winged helix-turn-helix transcriptional regulator, partial [Thermoplasmata archaeon]
MHKLLINRKTILMYYLLRYGPFHYDEKILANVDTTPKAISRNLGLSPALVSNTLRALLREGLVERKRMHVRGEPKKAFVYRLTTEG